MTRYINLIKLTIESIHSTALGYRAECPLGQQRRRGQLYVPSLWYRQSRKAGRTGVKHSQKKICGSLRSACRWPGRPCPGPARKRRPCNLGVWRAGSRSRQVGRVLYRLAFAPCREAGPAGRLGRPGGARFFTEERYLCVNNTQIKTTSEKITEEIMES